MKTSIAVLVPKVVPKPKEEAKVQPEPAIIPIVVIVKDDPTTPETSH